MCLKPLTYPYLLHSSHGDRRQPVKKALFVAIRYNTTGGNDEGFGPLEAPHEDAESFKQLLLDKYDYRESNITVLLDTPDQDKKLTPTRENILREIARLVEGAQPGDTFVFYFSGHCDQIESKSRSEEDGKDEVILPMDHEGLEREDKLILDNKLRDMMVDPLPPGTTLTAIFDSCHSGTLLDLTHYKCNGSYYPWISKGPRGFRSRWQSVDRQAALFSSPKGTRIIQTHKTSERKAESRESSIVILPSEGGFPKRISIETKTNRLSLGEAMDSMDQKVNQEVKQSIDTTNVPPTVPEENDECTISDFGILGIPRCTSPTQDLRCTGDSECINSPVLRPHVVSLSACADWEIVWDTPAKFTMTKALIEVLKENPEPLLGGLVEKVAYRLHGSALQLHKDTRQWKDNLKKTMAQRARQLKRSHPDSGSVDYSQSFTGDEVNFWTPQLGSLKRVKLSQDHLVL